MSKERFFEVTKPGDIDSKTGFVTSFKRSLLTRYMSHMWANEEQQASNKQGDLHERGNTVFVTCIPPAHDIDTCFVC